MTAPELARAFGWKRGPLRAKCPVHHSKGYTLAFRNGTDNVMITCFAGCDRHEILAAVGLTWRHTYFSDVTLTPEERKAYGLRKRAEEQAMLRVRREALTQVIQAVESSNKPVRTPDEFEKAIAEAFPC